MKFMKQATCFAFICLLLLTSVYASEVKKVSLAELDAFTIQSQGLLLNNFNFVIEKAWMGGIKATAQCTGRNRSKYDLNYTLYIAAFSKEGTLIACFGLEPLMNIHEAGKIETLEMSGMVETGSKGKIDYFLLKVVIQKPLE